MAFTQVASLIYIEGSFELLTHPLTLFVTDCQPVKRKSEGVRVKKQKKFFFEVDELTRILHQYRDLSIIF